MTDQVDTSLARAKLYAAIAEQAGFQQQPFVLRPSNIGQCPLRLKFESEASAAGLQNSERGPRMIWSAYQGEVTEELTRLLLRSAGAEIIEPPEGSDVWMADVEPDPETGFKPHIDGLIRWPEIGIEQWSILEVKNLRVYAHLDLLFDRLYAERTYWFQAVSYLRIARLAMEQYARHSLEWNDLHEAGVVPQGIFFVSVAKDPATTNMMANQQTSVAQYETKVPAKGYKPEQIAMMAKKQIKRERLEANDNDPSFYFEYVDRNDPSVLETWDDIINIKRQVELSPRPEPLHNIAVSDDDLPTECRWYCGFLEQHRMMGFTPIDSDLTTNEEDVVA